MAYNRSGPAHKGNRGLNSALTHCRVPLVSRRLYGWREWLEGSRFFMTDVFISYSKSRAAVAASIANELRDLGFVVWWDTSLLPTGSFGSAIDRELDAAKAVVVVWSPEAARSKWVYSEAQHADRQEKLVNCHTAEIVDPSFQIPKPFGAIHSVGVDDIRAIVKALDSLKVPRSRQMGITSIEETEPSNRLQSTDDKLFAEVQSKGDIEAYEFYLNEFPDGSHAPVARFRLNALRSAVVAGDASKRADTDAVAVPDAAATKVAGSPIPTDDGSVETDAQPVARSEGHRPQQERVRKRMSSAERRGRRLAKRTSHPANDDLRTEIPLNPSFQFPQSDQTDLHLPRQLQRIYPKHLPSVKDWCLTVGWRNLFPELVDAARGPEGEDLIDAIASRYWLWKPETPEQDSLLQQLRSHYASLMSGDASHLAHRTTRLLSQVPHHYARRLEVACESNAFATLVETDIRLTMERSPELLLHLLGSRNEVVQTFATRCLTSPDRVGDVSAEHVHALLSCWDVPLSLQDSSRRNAFISKLCETDEALAQSTIKWARTASSWSAGQRTRARASAASLLAELLDRLPQSRLRAERPTVFA